MLKRYLPSPDCYQWHHPEFYFKIQRNMFCCWRCWRIYWVSDDD